MKNFKKDILMFIIIFIFTIIIFQLFLRGHYATDTYVIIDSGYKEFAIAFLVNARVFSYLMMMFADFFSIHIDILIVSSLIIGLFISCTTVMLIKNIILKYRPAEKKYQEVLILIVSYFTIFNFMYLENLHFAESAVMSMSVLLYILSAKSLVEKPNKYLLKSLVFFILGIFSYQGTNGIFFAMVALLSMIKNKDDYKRVFKDLAVCIFVAGIGVMLNIIQVRLANSLQLQVTTSLFEGAQKRLTGIMDIPSNIFFVVYYMPYIFNYNCGLFPPLVLVMLIIAIIFYSLKYFSRIDGENKVLGQFIVLIIITAMSSFAQFAITLSTFNSGRMHFTIGAFLGILYIFLYCNTEIFKTKLKNAVISIFAMYSCVVLAFYVCIMYAHKKTNELDRIKAQEIGEYISNYEEENNIEVKNVHIYIVEQDFKKGFYDEILLQNVLTQSALKGDWSAVGAINFYTGRNLILNQEAKEYVKPDNCMEEEYMCVEDTLYMNVYFY